MYKKMELTEFICQFKNSNCADGIYIINNDREEKFISYSNLYNKALYMLHNLQTSGLEAEDELIFQIKDEDNEIFIYTFWACLLGGIIPVPITVGSKDSIIKVFSVWKQLKNPKLIQDEKSLIKLCKFATENGFDEEFKKEIQSKTLLIDDMMIEVEEGLVKERDLDDIAFIQFSSGSTGEPKGIVLTHRNLITNIIGIIQTVEITEEDSTLSWMPLTHDMGIIGFHLVPLVAKVNQYIMPTYLFVRNPIVWMKKVNEHRTTLLSSPNFGYKYLLERLKDKEFQWDLSCVRKIFNGAEPISVDIIEEFMDKFSAYGLKRTTMYPVYGMAEASLAVAFPPAHEEYSYVNIKRESLGIGQKVIYCEDGEGVKFVDEGFPVKGCCIRIVSDNNDILGEGVVGYIHISGDNVTKGYYNNKQATDDKITKDGWVNTGDLGFIRDNRIVVTGRYKDIIFVNGCNYYSHDLEKVCEKVNGISVGKLAVCGLFDERIQKEKVVIFFLFKKKLEEFIPIAKEIKTNLMRDVGITVDDVIPVRSIPKTTSGKYQRYKLVEMYKSDEFKQLVDEINELNKKEYEHNKISLPKNEIEAVLVNICKKIFNTEDIGVDDNFIEYGGNSLIIASIHSELESLYPGKVKIADIFSYPTIAKLADFIKVSNKIVLKEVAITKEYESSDIEEADIDIDFTIDNILYSKIRKLADKQGLEIHDILLSVYIFLISKISGSNQVTVQSSIYSNSTICSISVDINEIASVSDLFKITKQMVSSNDIKVKYSLADLAAISLTRSRLSSIVPLFINNKIVKKYNGKLTEVFDLILRVKEISNKIEFVCQSNGKIFSDERLRALMNYYLQLIELLVSRGLSYE